MTAGQDPEAANEAAGDSPKVPHRELRDPRALRALAHPVRLRLLEELAAAGVATATELSERVGESPANCSWHLRQLAQYGFVEESGGGRGRQRPWRIVIERTIIGPGDGEPEVARAVDAVAGVVDDRTFQAIRAWRAQRRSLPEAWRRASFNVHSIVWLTAEELAQMEAEINQILDRHVDRAVNPSRRPPGARAVRLAAWGFPSDFAGPAEEQPKSTAKRREGHDDR